MFRHDVAYATEELIEEAIERGVHPHDIADELIAEADGLKRTYDLNDDGPFDVEELPFR